jgi:hypothetical protein
MKDERDNTRIVPGRAAANGNKRKKIGDAEGPAEEKKIPYIKIFNTPDSNRLNRVGHWTGPATVSFQGRSYRKFKNVGLCRSISSCQSD